MNIKDLRIGTRIDLELINSLGERIGQTYVSQVLDVIDTENLMIATPIHESRFMLITNGTRVRIVFLHHRYGLLCFTGTITGKDRRDNIILLVVKKEGDFDKIQRRSYFRLDCNLNAVYRLYEDKNTENSENIENVENMQSAENAADSQAETESGQEQCEEEKEAPYKKAITKNISGNGACIVVDDDIPKSSLIEVRIWFDRETEIKAICKVVRNIKLDVKQINRYELGLYFHSISPKDQDAVVRYIFNKQRHQLKNSIVDKK